MRLSPLVPILVAGCHTAGDDADHARLPPSRAPGVTAAVPSAPPGARRVTARVVEYLGVAWADVLRLELEGDLVGPAWLYLPAGDDAARRCAGDEVRRAGDVLHLQLAPMAPPDAAAGGPYTFHLETPLDGGMAFWAVNACDAAPPRAR